MVLSFMMIGTFFSQNMIPLNNKQKQEATHGISAEYLGKFVAMTI